MRTTLTEQEEQEIWVESEQQRPVAISSDRLEKVLTVPPTLGWGCLRFIELYPGLDTQTDFVGGKQSVLLHEMPPPALVIEIVSPGQENREHASVCQRHRDYRHKRTEYAARGISEYWIIDPEMQQITRYLWVSGQYEDTIYTGDTPIESTVIPDFALSAAEILAFGQN